MLLFFVSFRFQISITAIIKPKKRKNHTPTETNFPIEKKNMKGIEKKKQKSSEKTQHFPKEFKYEVATSQRFEIPKRTIGKKKYELLVSNGFVKLYASKGRAYWIAQVVVSEHKSPDWKVHFSVARREEVSRAWDAIGKVFVSTQCKSSMKAISPLQTGWPDSMHGREVTVYIFRYHSSYGKGLPIRKDDGHFGLIPISKDDEHDDRFWIEFIEKAEDALESAGVTPGRCADGDLAIGKFSSLRNEAFVVENSELKYPPNHLGWNAAKQSLPFSRWTVWYLHAKAIIFHHRQLLHSIPFFFIAFSIIIIIMWSIFL